jgi:hypothetical protein
MLIVKQNGLRIAAGRNTLSNRAFAPLACCAVLATMLSACALGRDTLDIAPPTASAPATGTAAVKIVDIEDKRVFESDPRDPSTPSLEHDSDIANPEITGRAYARKRGGYGLALGDVVLPEGHTISDLVEAATAKAFQEKGYRVVDKGAPDYAAAVPVNLEIQKFWTWDSPSGSIECRVAVKAGSDAFIGTSAAPILGYAISRGVILSNTDFATVAKQALDDFTVNMKAEIKSP